MPSNKQMLVSVIIPTYNRATYITDSIRSVLEQKNAHCDFEIIVVDDGSTDNTKKILKPFLKQIRYIAIPHSGLPAVVRNIGLKAAKGNLIAFQDSDDLWAPDKLASQVPLFDDPKIAMSYANATTMDASGKQNRMQVVPDAKLAEGEKFESLIKENVISTLTVMIRREILIANAFSESTDLKAVEDYELWLRLAAQYPGGIRHIKKPLAIYRQHDSNISKADPLVATERLLATYNSIWQTKLTDKQKLILEDQLEIMHANWGRLQSLGNNTPTITVVMSVYNGGQFLKAAAQSILDQTFSDFEFIVIDDGSSDTSAELIRKLKDPRVRLVHQTNHGLVAALNKGLRLARGTFVARQDADDISKPERFKKELDWLSAEPRRAVVGSFFTYIDTKSSKPSITLTTPTKHIDLVRMLYYNNPFAHGSTLIRRQALVEVGGYRDTYGHNEDYDLWRRIGKHWTLGQIPEVLYLYRINQNSISHTNQDIQHKFAAKIIEELWQEPVPLKRVRHIVADRSYYREIGSKFSPTIEEQYVGQQISLAYDCLRRGKLKAGLSTAAGALLLRPSSIRRLGKPLLFAIPKRIMGR